MKEQWFDRVTRIGARILEILHWMTAALMALLLVVSLTHESLIGTLLTEGVVSYGAELESYGFRVALTVPGAQGISMPAFRLFVLCTVILLSLMAMVFRNLFLIMRNARAGTPFQPDNIRMLREIGWFCMAQPVAALGVSVLIPLFAGRGVAEASVDITGFIIGAVALSLTRVFARGMELERDTEGLL